jgi:hypothetical protein
MIIDERLTVAKGQQVTANANSPYSIDMFAVGIDKLPVNIYRGTGEPMAIAVAITAIGTNTGSTKLQVIESSTEDLATAPVVIAEQDLATADIAVGKTYVLPLPPGRPSARYLGVRHVITGTVDYTVDAWLATAKQLEQLGKHVVGYTA